MDNPIVNYIINLNSIKDDIFKLEEKYITSNAIKHKQLLVYYMYRIICKYSDVIKINTDPASFEDAFTSIGIPTDMTDKCYPLCGKISNDENELNIMVEKALFLFENMKNNIKDNELLGKKKETDNLKDFMRSKLNKNAIKEDLTLLSVLLPKISKLRLKSTTKV
jgi:hypothetical protein